MSVSAFDLSSFKKHFDGSGDNVLTIARLAESAERYEDMCQCMQELVKVRLAEKKNLNVEERNLLSVAYKNAIGTRRASWRTLNSETEDGTPLAQEYKKVVEVELKKTCTEVLDMIKDLLPGLENDNDYDGKVFMLKMAGDYYRYLAESIEDNEEYKTKTEDNYKAALKVAKPNLIATHPIRLGLALNFSVCYYEILKKPTEACELAKTAFDDAIVKLDKLAESDYKDSTLIMQLLRDNLTLWTNNSENVQVEDLSEDDNIN